MRKMSKTTVVWVALGGSLGLFAALGVAGAGQQDPTREPSTEPTRPSDEAPSGSQPRPQSGGQEGTSPSDQQGTQPGQPSGTERNGQQGMPSGQPSTAASEMVSVTATVEKVDSKGRKITLKDPEGNRTSVKVPPDVTGFEKVKKGDRVDITYYESVAMSIMPPGTAKPSMQEKAGAMREVGGGIMAREMTMTTTVTAVDPQKNTVTFKGPEGKTSTLKVQDPSLQSKLSDLKPGDAVQLTYTEAVATKLEPPAAKKQKSQE